MYLHGYGLNMMASNDTRFIGKILKNLNGYYYLANHDKKIIKNGYFSNGMLNSKGNIIDYSNNKISILYGTFINDIQDISKHPYMVKTKYPYFTFINEFNQKEYYANVSIYINGEKSNNKSNNNFLQIFINKNFTNRPNVIYNTKLISNLPLSNTYINYDSLYELINH